MIGTNPEIRPVLVFVHPTTCDLLCLIPFGIITQICTTDTGVLLPNTMSSSCGYIVLSPNKIIPQLEKSRPLILLLQSLRQLIIPRSSRSSHHPPVQNAQAIFRCKPPFAHTHKHVNHGSVSSLHAELTVYLTVCGKQLTTDPTGFRLRLIVLPIPP